MPGLRKRSRTGGAEIDWPGADLAPSARRRKAPAGQPSGGPKPGAPQAEAMNGKAPRLAGSGSARKSSREARTTPELPGGLKHLKASEE
jgi:hypothetical protein